MKSGILLSGGLDSIALAFWQGPSVGITIDYGQACSDAETRASRAVCQALSLQHEVIRVNCHELGSGDLARKKPLAIAPVREWWPFRNQLLITLGAMKALALGLQEILVGSVRSDGVHRDGSLEFYELIDKLVSFQEGEIRILAPAIRMSSVELIRKSGVPIDILSWAQSCHVGDFACGSCRGCNKHYSVMEQLGYDPY